MGWQADAGDKAKRERRTPSDNGVVNGLRHAQPVIDAQRLLMHVCHRGTSLLPDETRSRPGTLCLVLSSLSNSLRFARSYGVGPCSHVPTRRAAVKLAHAVVAITCAS